MNEGDGLKLLDWLQPESVQLAFFDPQYKETKGTTDRYYYLGDEPPNYNQDEQQIKDFCHKIGRVLKLGGFLMLWINQEILLKGIFNRWLPPELTIKTVLIWIKGRNKELHRVLGQANQHFIHTEEYCLVIRKVPYYGQNYLKKRTSNIFNHFIRTTGNRHNIHVKPYKMIRAIIKQLTKKGDLVIDPCAGNFGVLVACQSLGREFMGCDISVGELLRFNINRENSRLLLKKEILLENGR